LTFFVTDAIGQQKKKANKPNKGSRSRDSQWQTHNSMNSLDWVGVYRGTLPCADCDAIQTIVKLNQNNTYQLQTKYLGKSSQIFEYSGVFLWNKQGNIIALTEKSSTGDTSFILVGENTITYLDKQRQEIKGELAQYYILRKETGSIVEKYWKLTTLAGKSVKTDSLAGREAYLILKNNSLTGNGGCNTLMGQYNLGEPNKISFGQIASTMKTCPKLEEESLFLKALEKAACFVIMGDYLSLKDNKNVVLAKFEAVYLK
jgi:uncharacterized lipoprotein NlpE involved in copper resistance